MGLLPTGYGVFGISVVNEHTVWGVAFNQNTGNGIPQNHIIKVVKTTDGGANWAVYDVEEAQGRISFDIVAFDEYTAFITTQDYNNGNGRGVFKTEDGGENWEEKFHNIAAGVWIRFFNSQEAVIINRQFMATTQDGGESWQLVPAGSIPAFQNDEFTILSSGNNSCQVIGSHLWFGTSKGRVFRSKDKGHTWEVFNTSLGSSAWVLSVAFQDTLTGIAINTSTFFTKFSKTNDGGETWVELSSSPDVSVSNLTVVPDSEGALIGIADRYTSSFYQVSAYSTNFGQNWEIITNNIAFGATQFIGANVGWASRGEVTSSGQNAMFKWQGDIFVNTTAIEPHGDYKVFPNPFVNNLNIEIPKPVEGHYRLYTTAGQFIQAGKITPYQAPIHLAHLKVGMYQLEMLFDDGTFITKKIVKAN